MTSDEDSSNKFPRLCQSLSPFGEDDGHGQRMYFERIDTLNFIAGLVNYALVIVIGAFMILTLVRKNKLTNFTWKGLCTLIFMPLISGTS